MNGLLFKRWSSVIFLVAVLAGGASAAHFTISPHGNAGNMIVFIDTVIHPTINGLPFGKGNEVAVFDSLDSCYGAATWDSVNNISITVFVNDPNFSANKNGMGVGEKLRLKVWDSSAAAVLTPTVTYYPKGVATPPPINTAPFSDSTYAANGLSILSSLSAVSAPVVPAAPLLSSPTNGTTTSSLAVTLSWSSAAGAVTYGLQVSAVSTFASTVTNLTLLTPTTRVVTVPGNNTTYYWRTNATNPTGTSVWSSIWNFTTPPVGPVVPAVPALVTPANNATNQAIPVALTWSTSAGALTYGVQVSTSATFTSTIFSSTGLTVTTASVDGLFYNTPYYWRANASNAVGASAWSANRNFRTLAAPAAPALTSPVSGSTISGTTANLIWAASARATSYAVQVSTVSTFATTFLSSSGLTATTAAAAGLSFNTPYYWRASATNVAGTSVWSSIWNFTASSAPAAPVLSLPATGSTFTTTAVTVSWVASSTGATSYAVQVSTVATFATTVSYQTSLTATSADVSSGLVLGNTYYWRANASNGSGTSVWSSVWNFRTITPPVAPTLTSPTNGAQNQNLALPLNWAAVNGATSYGCQVSTVSTFATTYLNQSGLATPTVTASGLTNSTVYYWRANAANTAGAGLWASAWSFTTIGPTAGIELSAPANGAQNQLTSLTMSWGIVTGATFYALQVSTVSTFASTFIDQAGITGLSSGVTGLATATTYYWHANATTGGVAGAWSSVWNFRTVPNVPFAPALTAPTNGASFNTPGVTLSWGAIAGVTAYTVQVSASSTFATTLFSQTGATRTAATGSIGIGVHYWRVNASNAGGVGPWSAIRSYTITTSAALPTNRSELSSRVSFGHGELSYLLTSQAQVKIALFDILGKKVLGFDYLQAAGSYRLQLSKAILPAGRYLLSFRTAGLSRDLAITVTR